MKTKKATPAVKSIADFGNYDVKDKPIAIAFYRVSLQIMEEDRQIEDVRRYCNAFGFNLQKEFTEKISGAAELKDRKYLREMLEYIEKFEVDYVVVSELSRLGRSNLTLQIIEKLTAKKICFISLKENIKTLKDDKTINATTQLLIDILNGINKFELETIKYRVKSGLSKTINSGTWTGAVPYGYNTTGVEKTKRLIIDEDGEAVIVREIFNMFIQGKSTFQIALALNKQKIPTKNNHYWKDTSIYKILTNSIYIGKRVLNKRIKNKINVNAVTVDYPDTAFIDEGIFYTVQDKLVNKTNVRDINKHNKYQYLLTGKIICACGKHFAGNGGVGKYICRSKKYAAGCNIKSISIDLIEDAVKGWLIENNAKLIHDNTSTINKTQELEVELDTLTKAVESEKRKQNRLVDSIDTISKSTFETKYKAGEEYIEKCENRIIEIQKKLTQNKTATQVIIKAHFTLNEETQQYERTAIDIDKEVIQKVIERIDINNDTVNVELINGEIFVLNRLKNLALNKTV